MWGNCSVGSGQKEGSLLLDGSSHILVPSFKTPSCYLGYYYLPYGLMLADISHLFTLAPCLHSISSPIRNHVPPDVHRAALCAVSVQHRAGRRKRLSYVRVLPLLRPPAGCSKLRRLTFWQVYGGPRPDSWAYEPPQRVICRDIDCPEIHHTCHPHCHRMIEQHRLGALLRVTEYSHETTPDGERRRLQWLRTDLASQLQAYHASRKHNLHIELWLHVADYIAGDILQYYATAKARAALSDHSRLPTTGSIATAEEIWCSFTEYEGGRYVSCLSNSPGGNGSVLLTFDRDQAPRRLLVAENHLGITKMSLADFCDGNALDETPGTWWRTIRLGRTGRELDVESDVRRTRMSLGCVVRGSLLVRESSFASWCVAALEPSHGASQNLRCPESTISPIGSRILLPAVWHRFGPIIRMLLDTRLSGILVSSTFTLTWPVKIWRSVDRSRMAPTYICPLTVGNLSQRYGSGSPTSKGKGRWG